MKSSLDIPAHIFPVECHDRIFLVGGCVRDLLLGRESQDVDIVAALTHDDLCALGFRLIETSGSVNVYFLHHPDSGTIEVTRINDIGDLVKDLGRRDFTINAMAMSMAGLLIDPQTGRADVKAGVLRPCSQSSFKDDPLRIIRAFRFEAGGWRMVAETEGLIRKGEWSPSFMQIPIERFSSEMLKALTLNAPERFFQLMIKFDAGKEFLPELFKMPSIPAGPLEHHPEGDLFTHSVLVLQRVATVSNDPMVRFSAFFHDLGKLATAAEFYPRHLGHESAGLRMAAELCSRLRLPAAYAKALGGVSRLHGNASRWPELRDATRLAMAEQALKAGIAESLPLVAAADKAGALHVAEWRDALRIAGMNTGELGIDQEKLQALPVKDRQAFILQRRVAMLRACRTSSERRN